MVSERLECAGLESLPAGAQTLAPAVPKFVHRPHALWADRTNRDHFQRSMTWCSWRPDRSADAPPQSLARMQPIETGRMAKLVMPGQKREARLRARCPGHPRLNRLERDEIRLGPRRRTIFLLVSRTQAARALRTGAHSTLHGVVFAILCLGSAVYRRRGAALRSGHEIVSASRSRRIDPTPMHHALAARKTWMAYSYEAAFAAARPAFLPENRQPPRKVPSSDR